MEYQFFDVDIEKEFPETKLTKVLQSLPVGKGTMISKSHYSEMQRIARELGITIKSKINQDDTDFHMVVKISEDEGYKEFIAKIKKAKIYTKSDLTRKTQRIPKHKRREYIERGLEEGKIMTDTISSGVAGRSITMYHYIPQNF